MPSIVEPATGAVAEAARRLRSGEAVAFPTETVYGLGVSTFDASALDRLYALKGRPLDNPLIAHVATAAGARAVVREWTETADRLAARFWPGPLTLVLPKSPDVPARATAERETIAVRCPAHPVAAALLAKFGGPVSAPSANRSGRVSPTTARHVADDFADVDDLMILDGGPCVYGLESTVLDLSGDRPVILRPGGVAQTELAEALGEGGAPELAEPAGQGASPGTSLRHYAPRTPAELVPSEGLTNRLIELDAPAVVLAFDPKGVLPPHRAIRMPQGAGEYARALYAALREADALADMHGLGRIVIEQPPRSNELWLAVANRLRRACSDTHA